MCFNIDMLKKVVKTIPNYTEENYWIYEGHMYITPEFEQLLIERYKNE